MVAKIIRALTRGALDESAEERKATWFELFFDLAFVVALSKAVHMLAESVTTSTLLTFLTTFFAIMLSWNQSTFYSDRFDKDDPLHRILCFVQMAGVIGLAAFTAPKAQVIFYAGSFLLIRASLLLLYVRAWRANPEYRRFTSRILICYAASSIPWIVSFVYPPSYKFMWTVGLGMDLLIPLFLSRTLERGQVKLSATHLPERFGLFTILALGECVVASSDLIAHHGHLEHPALAIVVLLAVFSCWWTYFDNIDNDVVKGNFSHLLAWEYSHIGVIFGFLFMAAGIIQLPLSAELDGIGCFLFGAGCGMAILSIGLLHVVCYMNNPEEPVRRQVLARTLGGIGAVLTGVYGFISGEYFIVAGIVAAICVLQVTFDIEIYMDETE